MGFEKDALEIQVLGQMLGSSQPNCVRVTAQKYVQFVRTLELDGFLLGFRRETPRGCWVWALNPKP